jgi:hypothetical protein
MNIELACAILAQSEAQTVAEYEAKKREIRVAIENDEEVSTVYAAFYHDLCAGLKVPTPYPNVELGARSRPDYSDKLMNHPVYQKIAKREMTPREELYDLAGEDEDEEAWDAAVADHFRLQEKKLTEWLN